MGINLGNTAISDLKVGDTQVEKVYLGEEVVWQKVYPRLPSQLQEVEYVETSGPNGNIFDTKISGGGVGCSWELDFSITAQNDWQSYLCPDKVQSNIVPRIYQGDTRWEINWTTDNAYAQGRSNVEKDVRYIAKALPPSAIYLAEKISGTIITNQTYSYWNNGGFGQSTILLAGNRESPVRYASMRIYSAKFMEGDTLRGEFIPCYIKSGHTFVDADGNTQPSGKIGLYDTVSGRIFVNQGTGADVTKGPDVN